MSKSVLVINTPENCGKCRFVNEFWCRANGRILPQYDEIPGWCPLKSLPEKLKQRKEMTYWNGVIDGWNQCINKITGGGDDEFSK